MTNFDRKYLLPTDIEDVQLLMWSYMDPHEGMLGYGTISALTEVFEEAAYYGDGEDHRPDRVWALTGAGPQPAIVTTALDGTSVRVGVKWLDRVKGKPGSRVRRLVAWYRVRDF